MCDKIYVHWSWMSITVWTTNNYACIIFIYIYIQSKSLQEATNSEMMPARDVTGRSDRTLLYSVTCLRSELCWKKIFHILIIVLMNRILHHLILTKQKMHLLPNPMCFYIKTGWLSKIFSPAAWHVQLNVVFPWGDFITTSQCCLYLLAHWLYATFSTLVA